MAKFKEKIKAQNLRKDGESIGVIAKKLEVSKSTVSGWCKEIALSKSAINTIASMGKEKSMRGLLAYGEKKRSERKRQEKISREHGAQTVGQLSKRDIYCIGLGLYWGEGYKNGNQEFGFTNSDQGMVRFYIMWLQTVFSVGKEQLTLRVSINALHEHRAKKVQDYWSELLDIPSTQFTKISLIKTTSKKVYENKEEHMGTLRIKVQKGTQMRREVLGAIESIS